MSDPRPRPGRPVAVGVVGHVEWVDFAVVPRLPRSGEILEARETFAEPGGGGAVAAVQMARVAGHARFLTVVGEDEPGARAARELQERLGVEVHAAVRHAPQRRAFAFLADDHERTITVLGRRVVPHGDDDLPWDALAELDAVYFTGGDVAALRAARAARVLVATPRAMDALRVAGVALDVLVASAHDPDEVVATGALDPPPRHLVYTRGAEGGEWSAAEGRSGTWSAEPLPGEPVDSYGSGDTFAATLAVALGADLPLADALTYASRCGGACATGRGPYDAPLPELPPPAR